jgi:hypothetical protein
VQQIRQGFGGCMLPVAGFPAQQPQRLAAQHTAARSMLAAQAMQPAAAAAAAKLYAASYGGHAAVRAAAAGLAPGSAAQQAATAALPGSMGQASCTIAPAHIGGSDLAGAAGLRAAAAAAQGHVLQQPQGLAVLSKRAATGQLCLQVTCWEARRCSQQPHH